MHIHKTHLTIIAFINIKLECIDKNDDNFRG